MTKIGKKTTAEKKLPVIFFKSKATIYLSLGLNKGRQSYKRKAFNSQKRTSSTSKHEIS
jgi:hypothetical protein